MRTMFRFIFILISIAAVFSLNSCKKDLYRTVAVNTVEATDIKESSAILTGRIIDEGEKGVSQYGHCWDTIANPTTEKNKTELGSENNRKDFSSSLTALKLETKYYARAYANDIFTDEVVYGNEISFTTNEEQTKMLMEGVWVLTEAFDSNSVSIFDNFQNSLTPITSFSLLSNNSIISTGGPMLLYIVYGVNKWDLVSSSINETFNYSSMSYNQGEFFVEDGSVDRFTIEFKLEGIGGTSTLIDILNYFDVVSEWQQNVVYHKFNDVKITFKSNNNLMTWEFDNSTNALYRIKDNYGDYIMWGGWPDNQFSKGVYVFEKQTSSLNDLVSSAYSTISCPSTVTDYDGNVYNVIQIGNQCWMKENLKTTHYADGTAMVDGTSAGDITGDYSTRYYFDYDNNPSNTETYGKLYTWAAAMKGSVSSSANPSGIQGACPTGWHLPSDDEWLELSDFLGGDAVAGGKMKEAGTVHWNSPNTGADNSSNFSALPGGYRSYGGSFYYIGGGGYWWSSTEDGATTAWSRGLVCSYSGISRGGSSKAYGFSVRCVRD